MYYWNTKPNTEIKRYLFEYLKLIKVDKKEGSKELDHIVEVAEYNGMKKSEINALIAEIDTEMIKTPKNDSERFDMFYHLITLLFDDRMFNETEVDFLKEMGAHIGYDIYKVMDIIKEITSSIKLEESEEEIKIKVMSM